MRLTRYFYIFVLLLVTGCTTLPNETIVTTNIDQQKRMAQLAQIKQWQAQGKIAFIQPDKRQSANLRWDFDNIDRINEIDLTTFLGINILKISHQNDTYEVEFDNNKYQSKDLDNLIYDLTGLVIPTNALPHWMQATTYLKSDTVKSGTNGLPGSISSHYQNEIWQIKYNNYRLINGLAMPHSITIKKNGITLKIAVKKWTLN